MPLHPFVTLMVFFPGTSEHTMISACTESVAYTGIHMEQSIELTENCNIYDGF